MKRRLLLSLLVPLASCRGCGEAPTELGRDPTGRYGHETMDLVVAAHGDRLVVGFASLFDGGDQQCACLLDMQRQEHGRWLTTHAGQRVVLELTRASISLHPEAGQPVDVACCGSAWPGDSAPITSRAALGACTTVSQRADVFLPVPYVEEPEASNWSVHRGDVLEGEQLFRAFDVWVLGRIPGPEGLAGMVRVEELDCGPS